MIVKLRKPLTLGEGDASTKLEQVDLSKLEDLTGADIERCVRDASAAKGEAVFSLVTDTDLHLQIAATASGLAVNTLRKLGARDFVGVMTRVQGFLMGLD